MPITNLTTLVDQLGRLADAKIAAERAYKALLEQAKADLGLGKFDGSEYTLSIYASKTELRVDEEGKAKLKELTSPQYFAAHTSQTEFVTGKTTPKRSVR